MSLKLLASRLEKMLAAEIHKMSDLVIAHQSSIQRLVSLLNREAEKSGGGEGRGGSITKRSKRRSKSNSLRTPGS
jgi:hypothetical protein